MLPRYLTHQSGPDLLCPACSGFWGIGSWWRLCYSLEWTRCVRPLFLCCATAWCGRCFCAVFFARLLWDAGGARMCVCMRALHACVLCCCCLLLFSCSARVCVPQRVCECIYAHTCVCLLPWRTLAGYGYCPSAGPPPLPSPSSPPPSPTLPFCLLPPPLLLNDLDPSPAN